MNITILAALAGMVLISGCGKNETSAPAVTQSQKPTSVKPPSNTNAAEKVTSHHVTPSPLWKYYSDHPQEGRAKFIECTADGSKYMYQLQGKEREHCNVVVQLRFVGKIPK